MSKQYRSSELPIVNLLVVRSVFLNCNVFFVVNSFSCLVLRMCSKLLPWFRRRFNMSKHAVPAEPVSPPDSEPSSAITASEKTLHQRALLLQGPKRAYSLIQDHPVPLLKPGEVLVRNCAIGLNPIDWKAP